MRHKGKYHLVNDDSLHKEVIKIKHYVFSNLKNILKKRRVLYNMRIVPNPFVCIFLLKQNGASTKSRKAMSIDITIYDKCDHNFGTIKLNFCDTKIFDVEYIGSKFGIVDPLDSQSIEMIELPFNNRNFAFLVDKTINMIKFRDTGSIT